MQPALVFIPGNMCDDRLWGHTQIGGVWRRYDAPPMSQYRISDMAAAVLAAVDDLVPIIPIGFSMGGIVALEMARQAPGRVRGLVLVDTNAGADLPERAAVRPVQQARVRAGEMAFIVANELKPNYLAAQHREDKALKELLFDMAMRLGEEVFVAQSEALRTRANLGPVLGAFDRPVLLLCGAEDALCPPAWHQAMADRCRDATLHVVEGAGHMLPLEQPVAFTTLLGQWLDQNKGRFQ